MKVNTQTGILIAQHRQTRNSVQCLLRPANGRWGGTGHHTHAMHNHHSTQERSP